MTLEVLEGELGDVSVASNDVHSEEVVVAALNDLRGKPINKRELDEALRLINDKDSLNAFGQFQPGEIGSTDLQVQVTDERAWSGQTSIDNTGSDATGRWRGGINLSKYDVTGHGDTLTLGFSQTKEVTLGSVSYTAPLPNPRTVLRISADTNEFAVGVGQGIKLEAETQNYRLNLAHTFRRSQDFSFDVIGETWFKDSLLDVLVAGSRIDVVSTDQRIVGGTLATQVGGLWRIPKFNTVYDASLGGSVGHFTFGEVPANQDGFSGQDSTYFMGTFAFQSFSIYSLPIFGERELRQGLMLRLQGQYSEQFLPAVEQFGLGGAGKVRAYLADDLSVDNAVYAGLQLYTFVPEGMNKRIEWLDQTIGDLIKPFAFIDYSYGVRRAPNTDTEMCRIAGQNLSQPGWVSTITCSVIALEILICAVLLPPASSAQQILGLCPECSRCG